MTYSLDEIKKYAKANFVPIVRDNTSQALTEICKDKKNILEIGTAIGYSGLLMLLNSSACLDTIEKDETRARQASENFNKFKVQARVNVFIDDAFVVLQRLVQEEKSYDMVFLDGAKGQYFKYFPLIKELLSSGGVLFADNINLFGLVNSSEKVPHKHRSMVNNMRKFIALLKEDKAFNCQFFDLDDGYCVCKKISD